MKTHPHTRFSLPLVALLLALGLTACDTLEETEPATLTDEEVAVVTGVVADGLALETDGLMAGIYDLTADVTTRGLRHHAGADRPFDRAWHGDRHIAADYDEETGEHTIRFERTVERPRLSKSVMAELVYIFQDADGAFLQYPRRQQEAVATITFDGVRAGSTRVERGRGLHASSFEHTSSWVLTGIDADEMKLTGRQARSGERTLVSQQHGTLDRSFDMTMDLLDVTITPPAAEGDGYSVAGTVAYAVTVVRTRDGEDPETRVYEGTLELTGDGHALMRIMGFRPLHRIDLEDGVVTAQ